MMNRSVMERQMFKAGGAAGFPDLSGDGKVTQKDILMGRGVVEMQMGGDPMAAQQMAAQQIATFVNPQTGERVALDMTNQQDIQMMDQLVGAGFVMDSPQQMPASMQMGTSPAPQQAPVGMQMGGDPMAAMMAQQAPAMPAPAPAPAMPPMPAPADNPEAVMQAGVGELDPAQVEQLLTMASETMGDPEQAGSYEEMMNLVRGDQASIQDRRSELANLVGQEDAMQTPESVLALVQPVVQVASMSPGPEIDQGIGGLAEQQMQQPVEGNMAGGIMSMMGG